MALHRTHGGIVLRGECDENYHNCPYQERPDGCYSDTHHLYGRAKNHIGKIARKFAELPDNKGQMCRFDHEQLHHVQGVLPLPDIEVMKEAIEIWRRDRYN